MRLIVGVDGSDRAIAALETVLERAKETDDEVTVAVYDADGSLADAERAVRDRLDAFEFDASLTTIEGEPGSQLVDIAETAGYDRIVLPGGQTSPLGKIQLDTVIEFVLLNAHTTVTLIR